MKNPILHTAIIAASIVGACIALIFTVSKVTEATPKQIALSLEVRDAGEESFENLFRPIITIEKCIDSNVDAKPCPKPSIERVTASRIAVCKKPKCTAADDNFRLSNKLSNASLNLVLENYSIQKLSSPEGEEPSYAFTIETFELEVERIERSQADAEKAEMTTSVHPDQEAAGKKLTFWERIYPRKKAV